MGPNGTDDIFDPSCLSVIAGQVKYKVSAATQAECDAISPIGLLRDLHSPLPYLALLMDLGNEQNYQQTNSKIQVTASKHFPGSSFADLTEKFQEDVKELQTRRSQKSKSNTADIPQLKEAVQNSRRAMDHYNRYFVSARGSFAYDILKEPQIGADFAMLLKITAPLPEEEEDQDHILRHMRPFERLGDASHETAWMMEYDKDAAIEDVSGKATEQDVMEGASVSDKVMEGETEDMNIWEQTEDVDMNRIT